MSIGSGQTVGPEEATAAPARAIRVPDRIRRAGVAIRDGRVRLVAASFLMLFVELGLIRWSTTNNIHLAYLTNFVLLSSFLGIGLGFLRAKSGHDLFPLAPAALAAFFTFIVAFPVTIRSLSEGRLGGAFGLPALPRGLVLPVVFLLTVWVMVTVTEEVARTFARFQPLEAYRLDILGSLLGIAGFAALSFLQLPPLAWGLVAAVVMAMLLGPRMRRWQWAGVAVFVLVLVVQSLLPGHHWSPYYKVQATKPAEGPAVLDVYANNIPHQSAYPVDRLPTVAPFYLYPYRHITADAPHDVLVIGAGTGNDVAVALAEGARHVDAVEIDPALHRLGRTFHPDHPYQDPRVTVHINDGRAFLERTDKRYDLIVLALTDSLTVIGGQSALRLENYLFTTEALTTTRKRLTPDGTFAMYNFYEPWLLHRYAGTVRSAYGGAPCVETGSVLGGRQQAVLTIGADGTARNCAATWQPPAVTPAPATDDHPFPYLLGRGVPPFYLWVLGLLLAAAVVLIRMAGGPLRGMATYLDLLFMGAAFLLLETKNVVQFALLFGTTWMVNAAVFAGILLSVLAAVELARRVRLPRPWLLYAALLFALAIAWVVPQAALLSLSPPIRFLAATVIAFAPIFLANLLFAQRFKDVGSSTVAFGANLLGAMVGGALEYLALLGGYRLLLIVVAGLYGLAFLSSRRHLTAVRQLR
jgi:hypothetical protein